MHSFRVSTFNVNWGLNNEKWKKDLLYLTGLTDVILAQETKNVDLHKIHPAGWLVKQSKKVLSKKNSAILIRKARLLKTVRKARYFKGVEPGRHKMLTRWFPTMEVRPFNSEYRITLISVHFAPLRFKILNVAYMAVLKVYLSRLNDQNRHWIIGGDFNLPINGPRMEKFARDVGARTVGRGIIGFVVAQRVRCNDFEVNKQLHSDHRPQTLTIFY